MKFRAPILAAVVIVLVLGVLWGRARVQSLGVYDQPFYLGIADDLRRTGRFTDGYRFDDTPGERPSGMRFTPLYPALLAAVASVDPGLRDGMACLVAHRGDDAGCTRRAPVARMLQFLMLAASFWMLWWSGWHCTGRMRSGWLALGLALPTAPLLLLSVDYLMTETISLFLFVLATTLALKALLSSRTTGWMVAAGAVLGLAILARPGFLWLGYACLAAGLLMALRERAGWRSFIGFAGAAAVVVLPWIVRNALVVGHASLTYGYASHTFVQRLSFDAMSWREYGMSFVCWLPDGNGLGAHLSGQHACDRFGWDDHPDSFYAIGIGPMLVQTLRESGGYAHHMAFLLHRYLLSAPLHQLPWHAMVTIPLALRGLYVDHYWGLVLAPVAVLATLAALRHGDRRFLLLSLPAWFMLAFNAAVAVNQVRYNLMLILPFSIAGAMAIERAVFRARDARI